MLAAHPSPPSARHDVRVLHVVESLGAGVASVVTDYATRLPSFEHHVLGCPRAGSELEDDLERVARVWPLPAGRAAAIRRIRAVVRDVRPHIVHAHSSWAGVYARVSGFPADRIVYTPHCFSFERLDVATPVRRAFHGAEWMLARRTGVFAAVGEREAALCRSLDPRRPVVIVPNAVSPPDELGEAGGDPAATGRPVVVTAGRICAQKDPVFFAEAAAASRDLGADLTWRWIGGGDASLERRLVAAGVEVTGWLPHATARRAIASASVYVHVARWEGFPVTLLEAAAHGLPIVVRRLDTLAEAGLPMVGTPVAMADEVARIVREPSVHDAARRRSLDLAASRTPTDQAASLLEAYAIAASRPLAVRDLEPVAT